MSKSAVILDLFNQGNTRKAISEATGLSYGYVRNVIWDFRTGGIKAAARRYRKTDKWRAVASKRNKTRRKYKTGSFYRYQKKLVRRHQEETKPLAKKFRQEWTLQDIGYLKEQGQIKCMRELALDLGRTYRAVQAAGHKFGVDLRGDKMGVNANRFRRRPIFNA